MIMIVMIVMIIIKMKKKETIENEFDTEAELLPQTQDWFDTINMVDINNNKNLIIANKLTKTRTIGFNDIGHWDIRKNDGAIRSINVVSPWRQSSYEPNHTNKYLC